VKKGRPSRVGRSNPKSATVLVGEWGMGEEGGKVKGRG